MCAVIKSTKISLKCCIMWSYYENSHEVVVRNFSSFGIKYMLYIFAKCHICRSCGSGVITFLKCHTARKMIFPILERWRKDEGKHRKTTGKIIFPLILKMRKDHLSCIRKALKGNLSSTNKKRKDDISFP